MRMSNRAQDIQDEAKQVYLRKVGLIHELEGHGHFTAEEAASQMEKEETLLTGTKTSRAQRLRNSVLDQMCVCSICGTLVSSPSAVNMARLRIYRALFADI